MIEFKYIIISNGICYKDLELKDLDTFRIQKSMIIGISGPHEFKLSNEPTLKYYKLYAVGFNDRCFYLSDSEGVQLIEILTPTELLEE